MGTHGMDGLSGPKGSLGPVGPEGRAGPVGKSGLQGTMGSTGPPGTPGPMVSEFMYHFEIYTCTHNKSNEYSTLFSIYKFSMLFFKL